eukprot:snap_masked-scaffold_1-processed-gene-2.12-mRNA-1 protein AED:0.51 eAED:1.00 QI:0/-1/0/1/-1/1/1/0/928
MPSKKEEMSREQTTAFAQHMLNDSRFSPERQAEVSRMVELEKERNHERKYDPEEQKDGQTMLISLHHEQREEYMVEHAEFKFGNFYGREGILKSDEKGVVIKRIEKRREGYQTTIAQDDRASLKYSLRILEIVEDSTEEKQKPTEEEKKEVKKKLEEWDTDYESEEEVDEIAVEEKEEEEVGPQGVMEGWENDVENVGQIWKKVKKFKEVTKFEGELNLLPFNNECFYGMDVVLVCMEKYEKSKALFSQQYKAGLSSFLRSITSQSNDVTAQFDEYESDGNLVVEMTYEITEVEKITDFYRDFGVLKKEVSTAKNYSGVGWPRDGDEVYCEVAFVKGKLEEKFDDDVEEIIGLEEDESQDKSLEFTSYYYVMEEESDDEDDGSDDEAAEMPRKKNLEKEKKEKKKTVIDEKFPPKLAEVIKQVKEGETVDLVIREIIENDPLAAKLKKDMDFSIYAPVEWRKANNLHETSEIVLRVTTSKIVKSRSKLDGKIKFKILNEHSAEIQDKVKTPRSNQRCGIDFTIEVEKEIILKGLGEFILHRGEMLKFMETVIFDMHQGERHKIWTNDLTLINENKEFDVWAEYICKAVFESEPRQSDYMPEKVPMRPMKMSLSGTLVKAIRNVQSLPMEKQIQTVREFFKDLIERSKKINQDGEMMVAQFVAVVKLGYLESKDTYWDNEVLQRREVMENAKFHGNRLFKKGCYDLAKKIYQSGIRVYSQWNFGMIRTDEEKVICRPIRFSLLLNLAACELKLGSEEEAMKLYDEAVKWCDEDMAKLEKRKGKETPDEEIQEQIDEIDKVRVKGLVKRAAILLTQGLSKLDKAKEDLFYVKDKYPTLPGLKAELLTLKKILEDSKRKKEKNYSGFLNKEKDIFKTKEARGELRRKEVPFFGQRGRQDPTDEPLSLKDVPRDQWVKRAEEYYGIVDHDLD